MKPKSDKVQKFYRFYLKEHSNIWCRRFHFIGTTWFLIFNLFALFNLDLKLVLFAFLGGYGFAWIGHFVFEKNRPASFRYPILSFICDGKMYWDMIHGRIKI